MWKYIIGTVIAILLLVVLSPFTIVTAGHRGVVYRFGAVNRVLGEGFHFRTPLVEGVEKFDVRTAKHEVRASSYSNDIQTVDTLIALNYHLKPESVGELVRTLGSNYEERVIDPAIQESVKAVTANYTAQALIEERPKVKDAIKAQLTERLMQYFILVDEVSIVNFDFSDSYESAVERKQVAQQDALTAKNKLEQVKFEADQRIAQATAEAEAIRIQVQAITQQGGEDYVRLKAVEKWKGDVPTTMIPGASIPFINLK